MSPFQRPMWPPDASRRRGWWTIEREKLRACPTGELPVSPWRHELPEQQSWSQGLPLWCGDSQPGHHLPCHPNDGTGAVNHGLKQMELFHHLHNLFN